MGKKMDSYLIKKAALSFQSGPSAFLSHWHVSVVCLECFCGQPFQTFIRCFIVEVIPTVP